MKINDVKNKTFSSSDFYLCAYLKTKGLKLIDISKDNPQRILFIFEDIGNRQKLIEDFLFERGSVEPKRYASAIKELKDLIHS